MMLRTLAALSLGTLAATTAVASFTATEGGDRTKTVSKKMTDAKDIDQDLRLGGVRSKSKTPVWTASAKQLLEGGMLDELSKGASKLKAAAEAREAGEDVTQTPGTILPPVRIPKSANNAIVVPYDIQGNVAATGRITLKFKDGLGARASLAGTTPVLSTAGAPLGGINALLQGEGGTIRQLIQHPEAAIQEIRTKAFERSGRVQPDLSAMMVIELPGPVDWNRVVRVAREINDIPEIEWVNLEPAISVMQDQECDPGNGTTCNFPNSRQGDACWTGFADQAALFPGTCNPNTEDPDAAQVGCSDEGCCGTISGFLPWCDDQGDGQGWDVYCAAAANVLCTGSIYDNVGNAPEEERYDPCLSNYRADPLNPLLPQPAPPAPGVEPFTWTDNPLEAIRLPVFQTVAGFVLESCFEAHTFGGCSIPSCCVSVCLVDPVCCTEGWDDTCVAIANESDGCENPQEGPTPNWSEITIFENPADPQDPANGFAVGLQAFLTADLMQGVEPLPVDPEDPGTYFRGSGFRGGGLDIEGAHETVGIIWRLYGSGAINGDPVLPNPTMVWLDGAEFEVVAAADCTSADCVQIFPDEPRSFSNPFPRFAADRSFDYSTIRLNPTGNTEQIAVCEFSAFINHEEWCYDLPRNTPGTSAKPTSVISEEGQTLNLLDIGNAQHGTACLGVIAAPDNDFGVIGIAPRAQAFFFPIESVEEGSRAETAMSSMILDLEPGAVINHSWGPTAPGQCLTAIPAYYTLIRASTDAGLVVCLSAGNDGCSLVPEANPEIPSGGIIVGAREPGQFVNSICNLPRRIFFSTHSGESLAISVNAWGICGGTTGYGDLWTQEDDRAGLNFVERQHTRSYTGPTPFNPQGGFSGTSFAGPQIAGASTLAQGAVRMFWDQGVSGDTMVALVANSGADPSNCQALGYPPECPQAQNGDGCNGICGDFLPPPPADPAGTITNIGPSCILAGSIAGALSVVSDPTRGNLEVYTGTVVRGASIALAAVDQNLFVVRSEMSFQGPGPAGLVYFGNGQTIDFGAKIFSNLLPDDVVSAGLATVSRSNSPAFEMPFALNQNTGRWDLMGVDLLEIAPGLHLYPFGLFGSSTAPSVYFDEEGAIQLRIYTLGLGFINGGFDGFWDAIIFDVNGQNNPL
ncbi:MAG: hypothetical protein CMJ23_15250 [Phycisphaerae bacterium]|nr:hypothetical protein [Phycisphaerae bacterium]